MIVHAFTTPKYVHEVTLPALERGLAAAGRSRKGFQLACPVFVVTGRDAREWEQSRAGVCKQIAFYGSTPAYRGVLEVHGWGALQGELNAMSKRGEWDAMGACITDEILDQFAIVARPDEVPGQLKKRYGDSIDRVLATFALSDDAHRKKAMAELRG